MTPQYSVGEGLRTRDLHLLNLKEEVLNHYRLHSSYRKLIPQSNLIYSNFGQIVALQKIKYHQGWVDLLQQNVPTLELHASEPSLNPSPTGPTLAQTKKIRHYRRWDLVTGPGGVKMKKYTTATIKFYRAVHVDTTPFLCLPDLWLTIPKFQELLSSWLPDVSFRNDLKQVDGLWVPGERSVQYNNQRYVQEGFVGTKLLFKYDTVRNRWGLWD